MLEAAVRKDTDVATVAAGILGQAGEDRAIQEAQIRLERMRYCHGAHHGLFDSATVVDELVELGRNESEPERLRVNQCIKCPAVGCRSTPSREPMSSAR